jgi:hypothetical protein
MHGQQYGDAPQSPTFSPLLPSTILTTAKIRGKGHPPHSKKTQDFRPRRTSHSPHEVVSYEFRDQQLGSREQNGSLSKGGILNFLIFFVFIINL